MIAGDGETWTILSNQSTVIGLFHGMFESNILTFNPGWTGLGEALEEFTDIRVLSDQLTADGLELAGDTTKDTPSGPASFMVTDPDGNTILIDQHVQPTQQPMFGTEIVAHPTEFNRRRSNHCFIGEGSSHVRNVCI